MKIGDLLFGVLLGLAVGLATHSCISSFGEEQNEEQCDATEEMRLKIALDECSNIVITRAWQDDGYETN